MSDQFSPTIIQQTGLPPQGSNPKNGPSKMGEKVVRDVPGITEYNPEDGTVAPVGPYKTIEQKLKEQRTAEKEAEQKAKEKKAAPKKEETEAEAKAAGRHQAWKDKQTAKKAERVEKQQAKQMEQQMLAKDYLKQGNVMKAAEALGMTPTEFLLASQNAALGMQTQDKPLSPEEKKVKDAADYQASLEAERQENQRFRYESTLRDWVRENVAPIMKDVEKYELLNRDPKIIPNIQRAAYEYINQHYQETHQYDSAGQIIKEGEILKVEDVLNEMENYMENTIKSDLDKAKGIKKFSKYFTKEEQEAMDQEAAEEVVEDKPGVRTVHFKDTPKAGKKQDDLSAEATNALSEDEPLLGEEVELEEDKPLLQAVRDNSRVGLNGPPRKERETPFAFLTPEQKLRRIQEQRKRG